MPNDTDERYNIDIALSTNPALDFTQDSSQTNMGLNQVNWGWCPNQKKAQVNQYKFKFQTLTILLLQQNGCLREVS